MKFSEPFPIALRHKFERCPFAKAVVQLVAFVAMLAAAWSPVSAQNTVDGLSIPSSHPSLWWTPAKLNQAKTWFASHPFTPNSQSYVDAALHHLLSGNAADCTNAINWAIIPRIPYNTGTAASNAARWYGEQEILIFDWCYDQLSPSQKTSLITDINGWLGYWMKQSWGGTSMPQNNFYWGYLRDELEWGISSYNDQPATAKIFLDDALSTRWTNSSIPDANGQNAVGIPLEGTEYGRYLLWYPNIPFMTATQLGRDIYNESSWFKASVFYLIYATTGAPTSLYKTTNSYYEVFPFDDDQYFRYGQTAASLVVDQYPGSYYGEFMLTAANIWNGTALAQYAKQWLKMVNPKIQLFQQATDQTADVQPLSFNSLPLDYFASGPRITYGHSSWGGTTFMLKMGMNSGVGGHSHDDAGMFQIWRNGKWLTRETASYSESFAPWGGVAPAWLPNAAYKVGDRITAQGYAYAQLNTDCISGGSAPAWPGKNFVAVADGTCAWRNTSNDVNTALVFGNDVTVHNGVLINGTGLAYASNSGNATMRRLESASTYFYEDADLSPLYRQCAACGGRPNRDNPAAGHVEREFLFVRPLETMIVLDRLQSNAVGNLQAANVVKTFTVECEAPWTIEDGHHQSCINGSQTLRVTTLLPLNPTQRVVDEAHCTGCSSVGQWRLELDGSGSAVSYQLNVLQAKDTSAPNLTATMVDSNPSDVLNGTLTITLTPASGAPTVIVLNKGLSSNGGEINVANQGSVALKAGVETMSITTNGPVWNTGSAQPGPGCSIVAPVNGASLSGKQSVSGNGTGSMKSMQFTLDGSLLGSMQNGAGPYALLWDTTKSLNGTHTLGCFCTDSNNQSASCAAVPVNVNNSTAAPPPPTSTPPSCSITAPAPGVNAFGQVAVSAKGTAMSGTMAWLQLLLDGAPLGSKQNGAGPYSLNWDTTSATTANHTIGCSCGDSNGNQASCPSVGVSVSNNGSNAAAHPRVLLNANMLKVLAQKAASNDPTWTNLKAYCDAYLPGIIATPDITGSVAAPNISAGAGGSEYLHHVMAQGLCYQTMKQINLSAAQVYGRKLANILTAMSDPAHQNLSSGPVQQENGGYDIRNYGVALAIGYDWGYDAMTSQQLQQVYTALNSWIDTWDSGIFSTSKHPQSNYFAGYYNAKVLGALATTEENPKAQSYWQDWYTNQHGGLVQPWYETYLQGGGWPEGFMNYGVASVNQAMPVIAVKDIQKIDLVNTTSAPYSFPKNMAKYLMYFTWPSLTHMYDEDSGHTANTYQPGTPFASTYQFFAYLSQYLNDPIAPQFHQFARDTTAALANQYPNNLIVNGPEWSSFLYWNPSAPDASYASMPLSYWAKGIDQVAARSDWTTSAAWWSLRASRYINSPAMGEELYAAGEFNMVHGGVPLIVNPNGWLLQTTPGEQNVFNDAYGIGSQRTYTNTFQVYNPNVTIAANQTSAYPPPVGKVTNGIGNARTTITAYEEASRYTLATASYLEDMYRKWESPDCGPVVGWNRQVIYLRPARAVVFDRTNVCNASYKQMMAWHTPAVPTKIPGPYSLRYDVSYGGSFVGSMFFVTPFGVQVATKDLDGEGLVYRTEVTAQNNTTDNNWLTVFDLSNSPSSSPIVTEFHNSHRTMTGVVIRDGSNAQYVLTNPGPAGTVVQGEIIYWVAYVSSTHVLAELPANTKYKVTYIGNSTAGTIVISQNAAGNFTTSPNGVLTFSLSATGQLAP